MDDRNLTLIVVPHGDLETRSFVVSYRKLKTILISVIVLVVIVALQMAAWFPVALKATRFNAMVDELAELEAERAKVADLAKDLAAVEAQYERVRQLLGADAPAAGSPPMLPPLRDTTKAKRTGPTSQAPDIRQWPLSVRGFVTQKAAAGARSHPGIDIAVKVGSIIRAAGDGVVRSAGLDEVYGKYIVIDHGGGLISVYGHASELEVQPGDTVHAGQKIALSGSTGRSTAPHLHFEIRRGGEVLDPFRYVSQPR
jgi:murein DD-endopeptidase MepM/ murein hydrolase activator NlpD